MLNRGVVAYPLLRERCMIECDCSLHMNEFIDSIEEIYYILPATCLQGDIYTKQETRYILVCIRNTSEYCSRDAHAVFDVVVGVIKLYDTQRVYT